MKNDSVDKIVMSYFRCLSRVPFHYKGKDYVPKDLVVSPLLLRGYTCPENCGGCCPKFSLDYLPGEPHPAEAKKRKVEFNGRDVVLYSDVQNDNVGTKCKHLNWENGRCGVYTVRPFSCDFELIRALNYVDLQSPNRLTQKLYGRGWSLPRVDGERGALCEMTPVTPETVKEVVRKLKRFTEWSDHFEIRTWAPEIIKLVEHGGLERPVTFSARPEGFVYSER